ncbi:MAG: AAA family ATPase, partial [Okeania sp. SIO2D1]|nr:AAA family ATPase [Okeania sp. SIO2D1]
RLSELEKQVIFWIANQETAVDISITPTDFPHSHSDLWKGIQSLKRRCLVEKVMEAECSFFTIQPVVKSFSKML